MDEDETQASKASEEASVQEPAAYASPLQQRLQAKRRARDWAVWRHNPRVAVFSGILAANGLAFLVMLLTSWLLTRLDGAAIFIASDFVLIPMAMGALCAYFWQEAKLSKAAYALYGLLNTLLALTISYLFLREGVLCLLMASPLVLVFVLLGSFIGRKVFAAQHRPASVSFVPVLLTLLIADSLTPHNYHAQEADTIVIHAPPQRVWQYIIDYPAIATPPDYWLCRFGLPAPVQSTASGHRVGDARHCVFTNHIVFEEKITRLEPGRELMFDVVTQPNDPEVLGHFVLERGQFLLRDNGDGTTTVTGTSWYKLNVYPICYYDAWVRSIMRGVHLRVIQHVKRLAEQRE